MGIAINVLAGKSLSAPHYRSFLLYLFIFYTNVLFISLLFVFFLKILSSFPGVSHRWECRAR